MPHESQCCICGSPNLTEQALCEECQALYSSGLIGQCPVCDAMDLVGSNWHIEGCPEYGQPLEAPGLKHFQ